MKCVFKRRKVMSKIMTHYTSTNVIKSVIENKKIWFSDIRFMNDYAELEPYIIAGISNGKLPLDDLGGVLDIKKIEEYNKAIEDVARTTAAQTRYFILCGSLNKNKLGMWNYYGKGTDSNGCNITIDIETLLKHIYDNFVSKIDGAKLLHGKVFYRDTFEDIQESIQNTYVYAMKKISENDISIDNFNTAMPQLIEIVLLHIAKDEYKDEIKNNIELYKEKMCNAMLNEGEDVDLSKNIITANIYNGLSNIDPLDIECFVKYGEWYEEEEYRIVISIPETNIKNIEDGFPSDRKGNIISKRSAHGLEIPFLFVDFNPECILESKISPYNKEKDSVEKLEKFYTDNGIKPIVSKSNHHVAY